MKLDQQRFTLADPQTSGGLLVAVASESVSEFEQILKEQGLS
jgi:selenide,water dikinase